MKINTVTGPIDTATGKFSLVLFLGCAAYAFGCACLLLVYQGITKRMRKMFYRAFKTGG